METKDKLAEEILDNLLIPEIPENSIVYMRYEVIKAMQAYHEAKLREELIKYTIWHEELLFKAHALQEAIEHGVDEYLKQRSHDNKRPTD